MREIAAQKITQVVRKLCIDANCYLPQDVKNCIACAREKEQWAPAQEILDPIKENYEIADRDEMAICQDTGMACVFLEIGQDVHIDGNLTDAVNEGVRRGYQKGFLRPLDSFSLSLASKYAFTSGAICGFVLTSSKIPSMISLPYFEGSKKS